MGQAGSQMRGQQGPSEGDHAGTVLQDSPSDRRSSNRGFLRGCWCGGRTLSKCCFFFLAVKIHDTTYILWSSAAVNAHVIVRCHHGVSAAQCCSSSTTRFLWTDHLEMFARLWAFEAGNPNHLKLMDESFSYKPPESFIILVTMLHCNALPHATMLYSYARCGNTVYSDRMFSLYHTPWQPQIVKIVFYLKWTHCAWKNTH